MGRAGENELFPKSSFTHKNLKISFGMLKEMYLKMIFKNIFNLFNLTHGKIISHHKSRDRMRFEKIKLLEKLRIKNYGI